MRPYARLTIDDIARMAGVSRTTASMALNGRAEEYRLAKATVQRILDTAREHGFTPSHSARTLRSGRSRTLGLIVPELTNFAHASFAQAMEPLCHAAGYQLLVATSGDDGEREQTAIEHLAARQVDGLIVAPCTADAERYQRWGRRLPLYLIDRRIDGAALPYAVTDAESAVAAMVGSALEDGASEAYYLGGQPELSPSIDRLRGFRIALAQAGLKEAPGWIRAHDYRQASGYALMRDCHRDLARYPEVLFVGAITLLEGVLAFIGEHGHFDRAPRRIIGFDDHQLLDCLPIRVDSIEQDSAAVSRAAVDGLLALIDNRPPRSAAIPAKLHWRSRKAACD